MHYEVFIKDEKKEKETMATKTVKTEEEILKEELNCAKAHAAEMEKRLKAMEAYKNYEPTANEFKAMHTAYMNAGFTDAQAFELVKVTIKCYAEYMRY